MPIDYSKYPKNWKTEIVPSVLSFARNRCQSCGVKNGQFVYAASLYLRTQNGRYGFRSIWFREKQDAYKIEHLSSGPIKIIKVVLTISHLDHDETNHNIKYDRLKAMCQYCHLNYDAKEKQRRIIEKDKEFQRSLF